MRASQEPAGQSGGDHDGEPSLGSGRVSTCGAVRDQLGQWWLKSRQDPSSQRLKSKEASSCKLLKITGRIAV